MVAQRETRLQTSIVKKFRDRGIYAVRQRLSGRRGWPDLYVILRCGKAAHIEVKMPGNSPTRLQRHTLDELAAAGAVTGSATSFEEALAVLEPHMRYCRRCDV